MQVISAADPQWIFPFTGLKPVQFRRLVRLVAERGGERITDGRPGRQWALGLPDRVLLVATYWRTNLTLRQLGPLVGVSYSAAYRVIDTVGPLLALTPAKRRRRDQVAIVGGTLIPPVTARSPLLEELPVLHQPAGRDRRGHPAGHRPGRPTARQPQRHGRLPDQHDRRPARRTARPRRRRLPGTPRGRHPLPAAGRRCSAARLEGGPQHRARPHRAHPGRNEDLEDPA